ncbi:hypothetical protein LXT21_12435 [Myxococcus sp. K38C18041901]|uniref:hypothetical protein n=1 Tax=Myxococcus guangdongensis TaxID=2906760 RepID=UPI0020A70301|nr:hypothetical protein [Myxococcus guangdongensis]MCP3059585.1 hypothetical protein [Myxococcus guangdongensis]
MTFTVPARPAVMPSPRTLMGDFYVTGGFALPRMVATARLSRVLMKDVHVARWVS